MREPDIVVREAVALDREFVLRTAGRLAAFEPPPWRTPGEIVSAEARSLEDFFRDGKSGTAMFVAVLDETRAGFAFLETLRDYFTGEPHGHIGMIAVDEASEGRGVAGALMKAAERWARLLGYRRLTLHVFDGNIKARGLYEHLGYEVETLRLVKMLV